MSESETRSAVLAPGFREDLVHWVEADRRVALRVLALIEAVVRDPFAGAGHPEPLRHEYTGCWSRRITQEHRLVYRVEPGCVVFLQARYHY